MEEFNRDNCIKGIDNVLNRVKNMNDKVKALLILDRHEDELAEKYFKYIYTDDELYTDYYMELNWKWQEIRDSMTEKEHERYGNALPKEMEDVNWSKNARETFERRVKEAKEYKMQLMQTSMQTSMQKEQ